MDRPQAQPMKPLQLNFCPNCGAPMADRSVFGRIRRACSACGFIFFREPKLAVGALVERNGQVLLVRRAVDPQRGYWCLPAGYVEFDEGPVAAVIREVREETGLVIHVGELLAAYHVRSDPRGMGVILMYRAFPVGGRLAPDDDASEAKFFAPAELPRELAFASTRRALLRWRCGR
jgi:ADP-ribose pyrophosphatase YjhB (NUDIX family)